MENKIRLSTQLVTCLSLILKGWSLGLKNELVQA